MELMLIRHGELPEEIRGCYVGQSPVPLSGTGRDQCRALAPRFREFSPELIYVSPLPRALESARLIAGEQASLLPDARLCEIDFGDWDGLRFDEINRRDPELARRWVSDPERIAFPGGESVAAFRERVSAWLAEIMNRSEERIAAITHGGVLMHLIGEILHVAPPERWRIQPVRGSLTRIQPDGKLLEFSTVLHRTEEPA